MTTRAEVDRRIAACERCRDESRDCPEVVDRMNHELRLLHELHDAIPVPKQAEPDA